MKWISLSAVFLLQAHNAFAVNGMENVPAQPKATPVVNSIRDSSSDTVSSNRKGQVINLLAGAANMAQGYAAAVKCPKVQYQCAVAAAHFLMGALNFKQEKAQGVAANQAIGTFDSTDTSGIGIDPSGGAGYDPSAVAKSEEIKKAKDFMREMSGTELTPGKPFVYDPKTETVTTASGKKLKPEDFSSAASMAAAGISKGMIDSMVASQKAINAEAEKKAETYRTAGAASAEESGGGGGGWGGSGTASADDAAAAGYAGAGSSATGLGIDRDPAQLAGMQKNYNGEAIGVAGDSIFGMMTRRYKVKESQRSFYDESELLVHK